MTTATNKVEFKGKFGADLNFSYDVSKILKVFGRLQKQNVKGTLATFNEINVMKGEFGASKMYNFSKTNFIFAKALFKYQDTEYILRATTKNYDKKEVSIPLLVGVEGMPKEWLKLRGSVSMEIWGSDKVSGDTATVTALTASLGQGMGKRSSLGTTSANAGMTLVFGELEVDGLIAATSSTGTQGTKQGVVSLSNLMTRAALTYKF